MRGRAGPDEWGKRLRRALQWWGMGWLGWAAWQVAEVATCVEVVEDGIVGMGDMTSCRDGNMRWSGGGMGWLGWALWQAGGRCGRDILHEIIYRWIARRWNAGRNMVVDNMRKLREGSTDGKTMELSSLLYYGNVRWTLWKCKENIIQKYGYYYGNV